MACPAAPRPGYTQARINPKARKAGWGPPAGLGRFCTSMISHPVYSQVSALLAAVFILITGNGLSNTLIPLSATAASFPALSIGLIGSAYFGGMLVGCIAAPRIIARAGHIRAFSAFVAIATVATLLHP